MADLRQQITIDTDTTGVDNLKKALSDIVKVSDGLVGTLTLLSKSFSGSASAAEKLDSGFAGTIKKIRSLENTASTFVNTVAKLGEAQTQEERVVDRTNKTLAKQKEILEGMSREFTRGESSILATAKASGATNKELKELESTLKQIRKLMGTDPFDNSIGGLRNLENQIKITRKEYTELRKGSGLTKKDLEDLVRVQEQATVAAAREGAQAQLTGKYLKIFVQAAVKDATEKFYELNAALKASEARNEEYRKKVATSSESLQKRSKILDELTEKERVLQEMQKRGFSKQEAQRFVNLRDSGFKITEAKDIISREKLIGEQEALIASAESVAKGLTRAFNKIKQQQESDAADMMQSAVALFRKQEEEKNKILEQNIAKRKQLQQSAEATVARNTQTKQFIDKGVSSSTASRIVDLKIQGYSASEIRQIITSEKELTAAIDAQKNSLKSRNVEQEKSASSTAKYQQSLEKLKVQLEQVSNGGSLTTANGLVLFRKQLQEAGIAANSPQFREAEQKFLKLRSEIEKAQKPTTSLSDSLRSLSGPLRAIFPAIGAVAIGTLLADAAAGFVKMGDGLRVVESRIKIADGATSNYSGTLSKLLEISNENRKNISDVANLYSKISPSLQKLGFDTNQVLQVTDAFTKTLRISKADTVQASAAILQFSQALASGRLQGDEFRSIAENAPEFLRAMELALGKTAGELRKMSSEGQLTADVISGALLKSMVLLEIKSKDIATSIPDAFAVLKNNVAFAAKEIDDRFKVSESIANLLLTVAYKLPEAFRFIADSVASAGAVFKEYYGLIFNVVSAFVAFKVGAFAAATATTAIATAVAAARAVYVGAMTAMTIAIGAYQAATSLSTFLTLGFAGAVKAVDAAVATSGFGKIALVIGTITAGLALLALQLADNKVSKFLGLDGSSEKTSLLGDIKSDIESSKKFFEELNKNKDVAKAGLASLRAETNSQIDSELNKRVEGIKKLGLAKAEMEAAINDAYIAAEMKRSKFEEQMKMSDASKPKGISDEEKKRIEQLNKTYAEEVAKQKDRAKQLQLQIALGRELTEVEKDYFENVRKYGKDRAEELKALGLRNDVLERTLKNKIEYAKAEAEASIKRNEILNDQQDELDGYKKQNFEIQKQILAVNKQVEAIADLEIAKIDDAIATKQQAISMISFGDANDELIAKYREQIAELENMKKLKKGLAETKVAKDEADKLKKEFDKIQDDISQSITNAIANGGEKGSELLKRMFKAQVFRIFVEPTVRNAVGSIAGMLGVPGANGTGTSGFSLSNLGSAFSALSGGVVSSLASGVAYLGSAFGSSALSSFAVGLKGSTLAAGLAGPTTAGAGGAMGLGATAGSVLGPLAIGYALDQLLLGGKITSSVTKALGFGGGGGAKNEGGFYGSTGSGFTGNGVFNAQAKSIAENTVKQYEELTKALGGQVKKLAVDLFIGTDPSGSANTQLAFGGSVNGQTVFNRSTFGFGYENVGRDQASLEAAINEASLRTVVGALKLSDFADNIDAVIQSIDLSKTSLEQLNTALSDVALLNQVNTLFKDIEGSLGTLAGASLEAVKSFVLLAGGFENLSQLQNNYVEKIYSDEQKLSIKTRNLNKAFEALGIQLPKSSQEFKNLVESQDLTTASGQTTYLALLSLVDAFEQVNAASEQVAQTQKALSQEMLNVSNSIRETINSVLFGDMTPVNQLSDLQAKFNSEVQKALGSEGQSLIDSGNKVNDLITQVIGKASEIYASGPEYQRIKELVLGQASAVANRIEELAPLTYQEETISLLQSISNSSAATASAITGSTVTPTTLVMSTPVVSSTISSTASIDVSAIVSELQALRQEVADSGEINIKVVTSEGKVIVDETIKQIKDRSKRGELVIYADGVK